jgi:hypothetical protein
MAASFFLWYCVLIFISVQGVNTPYMLWRQSMQHKKQASGFEDATTARRKRGRGRRE